MGLGTVMQTALTGINAATTTLQVTAHNLANSQTPGFKSSRVRLASQIPQTLSFGGPPGAGSAGVNPLQIGRGVLVAGTDVDWSPGHVVSSDQPALLALDGEGLFILEGNGGERLYTRDARFSLNSAGELVTGGGERVLGYAIDADGQVQTGALSPLKVQLGSRVAGAGGQPATLRGYSISKNGKIIGRYSDGRHRPLGQLKVARFNNPQGLAQRPGNTFRSTPAAGTPVEADPGSSGAGEIISGATELSNVDLGEQLIELTLAGNLFRSNIVSFQTADTLIGELFFPWRR
jgi:flagellar hook protein FlgE